MKRQRYCWQTQFNVTQFYRHPFLFCGGCEDFMASEEEVPMRDSSDDTKEAEETARRLLPSEAVREFSSRDQVLRADGLSDPLNSVKSTEFSGSLK